MFDGKQSKILSNLALGHAAFHDVYKADGPSLHFHRRALKASKNGDLHDFAEMTYSLLVSWGMHRSGPKAPKMVGFEAFNVSISSVLPTLDGLRGKFPGQLEDGDWSALRSAFLALDVMITPPKLVAHSKVLAHWLPEIIAPIDRRYTLQFLRQNHPAPGRGGEGQASLFIDLHRDFFHPTVQCGEFAAFADEHLSRAGASYWDSSPLKLLDNVIMGLQSIQV